MPTRNSAHEHGVTQRVDPAKLPALLRTRLAGGAGEPLAPDAGYIKSAEGAGFGMKVKPEA